MSTPSDACPIRAAILIAQAATVNNTPQQATVCLAASRLTEMESRLAQYERLEAARDSFTRELLSAPGVEGVREAPLPLPVAAPVAGEWVNPVFCVR